MSASFSQLAHLTRMYDFIVCFSYRSTTFTLAQFVRVRACVRVHMHVCVCVRTCVGEHECVGGRVSINVVVILTGCR